MREAPRSGVRLRPLSEKDVEAALDLFEAVASEGAWLATEAPVDRREVGLAWRDLLRSGVGTLLVADEGGTPVGLAMMAGESAPEMGVLVRADRRGMGTGEALVGACIAWARERGAREVVLHVFRRDVAAVALYRKQGFEEAGAPRRCRRRNGEVWEAARMVKVLG